MNPQDILRYVDSLHREKNIDTELVFSAIEAALQTAAKRQYGEDADISVQLNRENGRIMATLDGVALGDDQIGRIGAQTAKQVIIQKVREAERDSLMAEYREQIGDIVAGIIGRADGGVATVNLGNVEAILPRSEQIPGETLHAGERVRAVVFEVKATGNRVRVVLSRTRPQLVQRLFEQEIPELSEGVIAINSISREPGYRSKVAVSSEDSQVDPIAVCVGYRGSRIKAVREELAGEHIDVVRYSDDPEVLIPNALQPAEVEQVLLCDMIGRAIVLVQEDQLSLAIGRRGQNVRLASKLCGWDIEIMTGGELEEQIERAVEAFSMLDGMTPEIAQMLVEQGYLSYDDLSVIEPDAFMELGGLSEEQVDLIVEQAEAKAEEAEEAAAAERQARRERERLQREAEAAGIAEPEPVAVEASPAGTDATAAGTEGGDSEGTETEGSEAEGAGQSEADAEEANSEDAAEAEEAVEVEEAAEASAEVASQDEPQAAAEAEEPENESPESPGLAGTSPDAADPLRSESKPAE
ncbi:transcription termination factor NusA [Roseiconus nitratireducens]|uniref:Transcription termination/antitermination protein NusA n=1 Tax=Roseiconus nitratireducens TaxID=2605748 RepID=A0A5M6CZK5_9BACT|nr:transcription termination factor NusA [Roseiconus nitratireducens]KAA5540678.1 transcription termination factor NusA [Roseiconus nitratireducens]